MEYITVTERPVKERNCFDEDNIVDLTVNKNAEAKKPIGTEWKYLDYRVTKRERFVTKFQTQIPNF